jgi:hypothetical protein
VPSFRGKNIAIIGVLTAIIIAIPLAVTWGPSTGGALSAPSTNTSKEPVRETELSSSQNEGADAAPVAQAPEDPAPKDAAPYDVSGTIDETAVAVAGTPAGTSAPQDPGSVEGLKAEAYPVVADALAIDTRDPSTLSPLFLPEPFDRTTFEADPAAYLAQIKPGRVFQPAQPGPDVMRLTPLGARNRTIEAGQSVPLAVRTEPSAPVTFSSFDMGRFENRLNTITVQADERGYAMARFTASPGVFGQTAVMAASPVASGQARFSLYVNLRDTNATETN